ncbi:MAG: hypothetical protein EBW96_04360 [Actinobacteria bacterium]|nr:hypothetical protein [Actinomycetota bacterium]
MKPGQKHTSGGDPLPSAPELPVHGWSTDETLARLEALRRDDVRWMTAWDVSGDDVARFAAGVEAALQA